MHALKWSPFAFENCVHSQKYAQHLISTSHTVVHIYVQPGSTTHSPPPSPIQKCPLQYMDQAFIFLASAAIENHGSTTSTYGRSLGVNPRIGTGQILRGHHRLESWWLSRKHPRVPNLTQLVCRNLSTCSRSQTQKGKLGSPDAHVAPMRRTKRSMLTWTLQSEAR